MKRSGIVAAAYVVVASATAFSASSSSKIQLSCKEAVSSKNNENSHGPTAPSTDKFAPRFDGLRFIETLVTAHR